MLCSGTTHNNASGRIKVNSGRNTTIVSGQIAHLTRTILFTKDSSPVLIL